MQTIAKEYLFLFNTLTDAEDTLRKLEAQLIEAQRQAEELFLEVQIPVYRVRVKYSGPA